MYVCVEEVLEPQFSRHGFSSSDAVRSIKGGICLPAFLSAAAAAGDFPAQSFLSLIFTSDSFFETSASISSIPSSISKHSSSSEPDPPDSVLVVPVVVLSSKVVAKVLKIKFQAMLEDSKKTTI